MRILVSSLYDWRGIVSIIGDAFMAKPDTILLDDGTQIPILYEDRSVLAIDKPPGWMLIPNSWDKTDRNLQLALNSAVAGGQFWARSRGIKFLHFIHRLDGDTSGILLFGRSRGAVHTYTRLFESRQMEKRYLAVVLGQPKHEEWTSRLKLAPDPDQIGKIKVDHREGKDAETHFKVMLRGPELSLLEARPVTGRTHQIRVHAAQSGHPIVGDPLYGGVRKVPGAPRPLLGLRSFFLRFEDPFARRPVWVMAPVDEFLRAFGFDPQGVKAQMQELRNSVRPPRTGKPGPKPAGKPPVRPSEK